jgi:hypothetical protein
MRPQDAVAAARAALADRRADGAYAEDLEDWRIQPPERPSTDALLEWAIIEPDLDLVVSTRRLGAPISAVKRLLIHLIRQYTGQLASQQTRVNVHLMGRLGELDERLADLNLRVADLEDLGLHRRIGDLEDLGLHRWVADVEDLGLHRRVADEESDQR